MTVRCARAGCGHLEVAHTRVPPRPCCETVALDPDPFADVRGEVPRGECPCGAYLDSCLSDVDTPGEPN